MSDPGPIARFNDLVAQEGTLGVIVQRITDADDPQTLKQIAKAWKVPLGKLAEWIVSDKERAEQYAAALRIAAEQAALEVVQIADSATPETVAADKLRVQARQWLAGKLAREKFGEMNEVRVSGGLSLVTLLSGMPRNSVTVDAETVEPIAETHADRVTAALENPEKISKISKMVPTTVAEPI